MFEEMDYYKPIVFNKQIIEDEKLTCNDLIFLLYYEMKEYNLAEKQISKINNLDYALQCVVIKQEHEGYRREDCALYIKMIERVKKEHLGMFGGEIDV